MQSSTRFLPVADRARCKFTEKASGSSIGNSGIFLHPKIIGTRNLGTRNGPYLADLQHALGTHTVDRAKDRAQRKFRLGSIKILDRVC